MDMKKAILFDFDGTLVDTQSWYSIAISKVLSRFNKKYTPDFCTEYFDGRCWQELIGEISAQEKFNAGEILDDAVQIAHGLIMENIRPNEGVLDTLGLLSQSKVKYAICSNSSVREISMGLEKAGMDKFFADSDILGREYVSNGKPASDIYNLGLKKLGVKPDSCFAVEDTVNGAQASISAGIQTVIFSGGSHFKESDKGKFIKQFGADLPFFEDMVHALHYIVYA